MAAEIVATAAYSYQTCQILISSGPYLPSSISTAFPKNSPFTRIVDHALGKMMEGGTFDKIISYYESEKIGEKRSSFQ